MVCYPELHLAPECSDEVSCDDTRRRPVLRGRLYWVWKGQSRLFGWQAGDPSLWYAISQSLKQRRHEGLPKHLLHRAEGNADAWGVTSAVLHKTFKFSKNKI